MKNLFKILFGLALLFFWQSPVLARDSSQITDWYIKDFATNITVNQDSSLNITERLVADCGNLPNKHGIFRIFPKTYQTISGNYILPLEVISITDGRGNPIRYSVVSDSNTVTYKMGNENIAVTGENIFEIKYLVKNAVLHDNQNFDELYYNILGNFWDLEIDNFSAQINFPAAINQNNSTIYYYTGILGSKSSSLVKSAWSSDNILQVTSQRPLLKREGITLSITFPKGIINPYQLTLKDKYGFSLLDILLFSILPFITFLICFFVWKKYGRDPHSHKTIVPEFEIPEKLTPIEMGGVIKKGGLHDNATAATIIRLGVLGYLTIKKEENKIAFIKVTDFELNRTDKPIGADLYEAEKFILNKIFASGAVVNLKDLKNNFYKELPEISEIIVADFVKRKLIDKTGNKYQKIMMVVSTVLFFTAGILFSQSVIIYSLFLTAGIILGFGFLMARWTPAGAELNWRVKGFKLYMDTAEKYRAQFQEQEGTLGKLLPYAILFGITKKWLEKMKDIYGENYFNTYHPAFMIGALSSSDFSNFSSTISELSSSIAANVSPSSSGVGGVGGAGGGAGGGGGGGF